MDIKELNKSQLILLAILLSFVTSIATGITTVTLMERAPSSVTVPINRIVRETVEKVVPAEVVIGSLSDEQQKLLEELKAIKPLTISVFLKGGKEDGSEDKLLGTGLFLGENKVVVASVIPVPKEKEIYVLKSVLGEQKVANVRVEKDFTIIEIAPPQVEKPKEEPKTETIPPTPVPEPTP